MNIRLPFLSVSAERSRWHYVLVVAALCVLAGLAYLVIASFVLVSGLARPQESACVRDAIDNGLQALRFKSVPDGIPLAGWLRRADGTRAIVLVHGINSHAQEPAALDLTRAYAEGGFDVLLFDLRAHGCSGGTRLGFGWDERADVRGAVDVLLSRGIPAGRVGLHGTSYGAAVALLAAADVAEVGAVVADTAFADAREVMSVEIEKKTGLPGRLTQTLLQPAIAVLAKAIYGLDLAAIAVERNVASIAPRPILFVHGEKDGTTPVSHAYRLKAAARSPRDQLWILPVRHTECIRLEGEDRKPSPIREACLTKLTEFFRKSLR